MNYRRGRRRKRLWFIPVILVVLALAAYQFAGPLFGHAHIGDCAVTRNGEVNYMSVTDTQKIIADAIGSSKKISRASISCTYEPWTKTESQTLEESGLTQRAEEMRARIKNVFGKIPYGGYEPGGVSTGHIPGSAHYEGRAIDYFFRPIDNPQKKEAGWRLAQWAVAHAGELMINTVIYDDKIWTRQSSWLGWRDYEHPSGATDNPILRHLDHVHIDVD